jgi:hypothetical protein
MKIIFSNRNKYYAINCLSILAIKMSQIIKIYQKTDHGKKRPCISGAGTGQANALTRFMA